MFHSIRGTVLPLAAQRVVLSTPYGIEWLLLCSAQAISHWQRRHGEQVVYTHILPHDGRGIDLYGYYSETERELFLRLIKVSGIGPTAAINMLSAMSVRTIQQAIEQGDHIALSKMPKIGLKSAQKIILALKGSVSLSSTEAEDGDEITTSLLAMGYDRAHVTRALAELRETLRPEDFKSTAAYERELFKRAIRKLT